MIIEIPYEVLLDNTLEPEVQVLIGIRYSLIVHENREDNSIANDEYRDIFRCLMNKYCSVEQILFLARQGEVMTISPEAVRALDA